MENPAIGGYLVKVCVWGLAILIRSGEACYGSPTCAHAAYPHPQQYAASQYYYAVPEQPVYQAYQTGAVPETTEDPKPTPLENFLTKHGKELIHITANTILQAGETIASVKKEKTRAATAVAGINLKCIQTSMGYRDSDGSVCNGPVKESKNPYNDLRSKSSSHHHGSEHNSFSSSMDRSRLSAARRTSQSGSFTRSISSRSFDSRGSREGSHDSNIRRSSSGGKSSSFSEPFSSSRSNDLFSSSKYSDRTRRSGYE